MKTTARLFVLATTFASFMGLLRAQDDAGVPPSDAGAPQAVDPVAAPDASAEGDVSFQTFYDQLADQGTWVQTDDYGYVWQPSVSDPDWAPYSEGDWVDSDDGWLWVSDESFGWATYHYGRWANIDGFGWAWVPGYRWAPAWVSWRYGGGYAGWAPLPPETMAGDGYGRRGTRGGGGYHFGSDVDTGYHIGAGSYNFVPVRQLGAPNVRTAIVNRSQNFAIAPGTSNITNINLEGPAAPGARRSFRGITAAGPPLTEVDAQAAQPIRQVQLTATNRPGRSVLQGNSLAVYAPRMNVASMGTAHPAALGQAIHHSAFNRGDSLQHPMAPVRNLRNPGAASTTGFPSRSTRSFSSPAAPSNPTVPGTTASRVPYPSTPQTFNRAVPQNSSGTVGGVQSQPTATAPPTAPATASSPSSTVGGFRSGGRSNGH